MSRTWKATGTNVLTIGENGIFIEVPVINPITGDEQLTPDEAYSIAMFLANALNDREGLPDDPKSRDNK